MNKALRAIANRNIPLKKQLKKIFDSYKHIQEKFIINKLMKFHQLNDLDKKQIVEDNLLAILTHAKSTVPFYSKSLANIDLKNFKISDLKEIPILEKATITQNFEDLISLRYDPVYLNERYTGGSTGNPLKLLSNTKADVYDRAHHLYFYNLFGYKKGDLILACSGRTIEKEKLNQNIYWSNSTKGDVFGDINFSTSYLTEHNISYYIEKLISLKPDIIRSYPSFLDRLANKILMDNIKLKHKIKGIVLTSEVCLKQQIERIENAFKCRVYLEYGNREITMFSNTFDHTLVYQTSPYYCYFEVLNDDGSDTKIGEVGRVITTSLINKGMPFVRYETGDYARVESRISGYMQLSAVLGRKSDFLTDFDGQKVYLIDSLYRADFKVLGKIETWQFYQKKQGEIEILIIAEERISKVEEQNLIRPFLEKGKFNFSFKYVEIIPKTLQGKQPFVRKDISLC